MACNRLQRNVSTICDNYFVFRTLKLLSNAYVRCYLNFPLFLICQSHSQQKRAVSPIKSLPPIAKPKTPPPLQKPRPVATLPQPLVRTRRLSVFHPKFQKAYANRTNNISPRSVTPSTPNQSIKCDVCHNLGTTNDVVR